MGTITDMTAEQIKRCATRDLEMAYFNLREYLKYEYLRAFLPTILFTAIITLHGWLPLTDTDGVDRWLSLLRPYLTTFSAFLCAFSIMYFGGRAWRSTKVAIAIRSELLARAS